MVTPREIDTEKLVYTEVKGSFNMKSRFVTLLKFCKLSFLVRQPVLVVDNFFVKIFFLFFLLFFILFPSCFVLVFLVKHLVEVVDFVSRPVILAQITGALAFSLRTASVVAFIDLVLGFSFAWLLTRGRLPGSRLFESLVSLPLVLPTSALGFSAATFWIRTKLPLSVFWFILLIHLAFTFPFVVGVLVAALKKNTAGLENAATILGASRLTVIRTVILPQIELELSTAALFSFARSLSETGATVVALAIFGASQATAPALISQFGHGLGSRQERTFLAAVISGVLIIISLFMFGLLRFFAKKKGTPVFAGLVNIEARVSTPFLVSLKNLILFVFLFLIVLVPSFFIITRVFQLQVLDFGPLISSVVFSFVIAFLVTLVNLVIGAPLAYFLVHSSSVGFRRLFDFLVDIPLIVPTVALGFSLGLYWRGQGLITSDILLIIFAHLAFTFPYVVRTLHDAFASLNQEFVEASRSLGASLFKTFKIVTIPLLAPAFAAAAVLVFARSLGETGATMAVSDKVFTAPVYVVGLVKANQLEQAGIASAVLIILSFLVFTVFRKRFSFAGR